MLGLWQLVFYGVVVISPVGAMSFFGVLNRRAHGQAAITIVIATAAMLLTATSYGKMARVYPTAGSAFTYVGQELHPFLGYLVGWGMAMDYMVNPLICIIWCSQQGHAFVPNMSYSAFVLIFGVVLTGLNLQGIRVSSRVNCMLSCAMGLVIAIFLAGVLLYVHHHVEPNSSAFIQPFYDPQRWSMNAVFGGTSLAVLTYIGFDGISTLAEEAKQPRRHILTATVLTCLIIGTVSLLEVYGAQLVWPSSEPFPNVDTAFTFVAQRVWPPLFIIVGLTLVVANFGAGLGAQLAAARLLYGMGRSGALPKRFFSAVDPKCHIPRNNVLLVGAVAVAGALVLPAVANRGSAYELGANLLNFGALFAFMGVNAAALIRYYLRAERKRLRHLVIPALGFVICSVLWWNLSDRARALGAAWMVLGILFCLVKNGGLHQRGSGDRPSSRTRANPNGVDNRPCGADVKPSYCQRVVRRTNR